MITLAGHGKDSRLIQAELPLVPNVGDRIREDCNNKTWEQPLKSLITEGKFIESVEKYGTQYWKVRLDNGKTTNFNPSDCEIIERAAAPVLVEEIKSEIPLEPVFKVGDRVYQENPDNTGIINKISRGKALVSLGDRTVIVPIGRLHHCDPNYSPKPKKSEKEIKAEEEEAIAKARDEYLKSQARLNKGDHVIINNGEFKPETGIVTVSSPRLSNDYATIETSNGDIEVINVSRIEVVGKEILLPFDYEIPDKEKGDENYTPDYFIEACRNFLGWFDLDPFSNAIAQKSIRAKTFWTKADNALTKDWTPYEKKIVNPPYSQGLIGKCIDKILEFCAIGETILIVNSSTSAKWFQRCKNACSTYLNPSKRMPFYNPYREIQYLNGTKKRSGNEYDQTVFYFGTRPLEFDQAFGHLGSCSIPIKKSSCLPILTGLEALEPSAMQPESPAKSKQLVIPISAKMLKPSTAQTSLKSQSLETLERRSHQQELISTQGDSPAQEPQTQEPKQDLNIQSLLCGLNISELSTKGGPNSLSSKTQLQLLITHCEQYLEDSEWLAISGTIRKSYRQLSLEVPKNAKDSLSLPTLTTNKGVKSRSSGQSKCEKWFRDNGLLLDTQCLSPQMMAVLFGFPMEWTKCLWGVQEDRTGASDLDISLEEPSTLTVVQQSLSESCTSIAASVLVVNNSSLDERLAYLQSERDRLINSGASPKGVWLEKSKPAHKENFVQVVWKSDAKHPWLGDKKSNYIGKLNSDEHKSAIAIHQAGQQLRIVEREIKSIEKKLSKSK